MIGILLGPENQKNQRNHESLLIVGCVGDISKKHSFLSKWWLGEDLWRKINCLVRLVQVARDGQLFQGSFGATGCSMWVTTDFVRFRCQYIFMCTTCWNSWCMDLWRMASMLAQRESSCVFATPVEYLPGTGGGCTVSARGLVNGTSFYILYDSIFSDIFRVVLCHVVYMYCIYYQYCSYITCALEFFSFFGGPQRFCALGCFRGFSCGTSEQSPCTEAMLQLSTAHQGPVAETESWNLN
jgi:hypothetical protein